jgi:hypothetical protein
MAAALYANLVLPAPAPSIRRQAAAIVRPWGLLAAIALGYVAYTVHTGWPAPPHGTSVPAAPQASARPPQPHALQSLLIAPRLVLKCTSAGSTTYTDVPCAADADPEAVLLP